MKESIKFAGFAIHKGALKFRTARNAARVHQLKLQGQEATLMELAVEVDNREAAARALIAAGHAGDNAEVQQLYRTVAGVERTVKVRATKKATKEVSASELLASVGLGQLATEPVTE